jgi:Protein of unknown function (DUF3830)
MRVHLVVGDLRFIGRFETQAPLSCAWLRGRLPVEGAMRQARWSGEAAWFPLGIDVRLAAENSISRPKPGQILLYAGEASEPELLFPYGECRFAWKGGSLAGNHVITLVEGLTELTALGDAVQFKGARPFRIAEDR